MRPVAPTPLRSSNGLAIALGADGFTGSNPLAFEPDDDIFGAVLYTFCLRASCGVAR